MGEKDIGYRVQGIGYRGEGIGDVLVDADVDEVLVLFCCVFVDGDISMVVLVTILVLTLICMWIWDVG